jgi:hypothetical protein
MIDLVGASDTPNGAPNLEKFSVQNHTIEFKHVIYRNAAKRFVQ